MESQFLGSRRQPGHGLQGRNLGTELRVLLLQCLAALFQILQVAPGGGRSSRLRQVKRADYHKHDNGYRDQQRGPAPRLLAVWPYDVPSLSLLTHGLTFHPHKTVVLPFPLLL